MYPICAYIYIHVYMRAYVHIFHVFTISKSSPPVSMSSGMIWSFYRLEAYHNISSTSLAFHRVYSVQYINASQSPSGANRIMPRRISPLNPLYGHLSPQ